MFQVLYDFLLSFSADKVREMSKNLKALMFSVEDMMGTTVPEDKHNVSIH